MPIASQSPASRAARRPSSAPPGSMMRSQPTWLTSWICATASRSMRSLRRLVSRLATTLSRRKSKSPGTYPTLVATRNGRPACSRAGPSSSSLRPYPGAVSR